MLRAITFLLTLTALAVFGPVQAEEWAQAEVRRIDVPNKRVTLRHGEIKSLDMPPMTMVFHVEDPALLDGLSPGDNVRVQVIKQGRQYRVTALEKLR